MAGWVKYSGNRFRLRHILFSVAPARISVAKKPLCWNLWKENAVTQESNHPFQRSKVCGDARPWSTMWKHWLPWYPSSMMEGKPMRRSVWVNLPDQTHQRLRQHQQTRVYEIDMTISVEEFIYSDEYCGGIANGKRLKACIPGGSSVPILPANLLLTTAKG